MEEEDNRKRVGKQSKSEGQHPFDGPPTSSRSSTPQFKCAAKREYWNRIPESYSEYIPLKAHDLCRVSPHKVFRNKPQHRVHHAGQTQLLLLLLLLLPASVPLPSLRSSSRFLPIASRFILSTAPALSAQTRVAPTLPHVSLPDNAPCTSPSCFIPLSSACARTPLSRQPTVSSLLKLRRTPHTAWYLEPACSAWRRCCAIATCRERPRSSGMCMDPVLGSGSGELCFAEAHCPLCL